MRADKRGHLTGPDRFPNFLAPALLPGAVLPARLAAEVRRHLVDVGTHGIRPQGCGLLRAHRSNFQLVGFVTEPDLSAMSALAHAHDANDLLDGEIELDECYFGGRRKGQRGRGAAGKVPVFGILERNGTVRVTAVPDVKAETLISLTVKTVRRGSIIYTDKFRSYDSLMFCGYRHLKIDHNMRFATGKVYINGLEGFWSWAKERLIKHHGVSKENFPLYLKELEFRYNHRHKDVFEIVADYLCDLVPKRD